MPRKTPAAPAHGAAKPRIPSGVAAKGRRIARTFAHSTILAAGLAFSQLGLPEIDSRFHLFDRTLVDRLHAPITRYHE